MNRIRPILLLPLLAVLGGCKAVVLDPAGDVAAQQRDLLIDSTWLMLLVIVPVMALTVFFAWRYRQSNTQARYEPDWDHSTHLELVIWGAPLLIIICLGALTWMGTHLLDPYREIGASPRDGPSRPAPNRSRSMSPRSTGNGCSSIRNTASRPSTNSPHPSIGRSISASPRRR
ncbi:MAG: hypothetical protein WDN69_01510 [Aliidongia sp.]